MKTKFVNAIKLFNNYHSHLDNKNNLLEQAFGEDSVLMDYDGIEEMLELIKDEFSLIFPNIKKDELDDWIEYYLYEVGDLEDPEVEVGDKKYVLNSDDAFWDMLVDFNNKK